MNSKSDLINDLRVNVFIFNTCKVSSWDPYKVKNKLFLFVLFAQLFYNCKPTNTSPQQEKITVPIKYAKGFKIYQTNKTIIYEVFHPQTGEKISVFNQNKTQKLNKVIVFSSTHLAFLNKLNELNTVKGVTYGNGIFNPLIKQNIANKTIIDLGSDVAPNKELIVNLKPDVLFSYPSVTGLNWAEELGIPVIYITEYLENDPLAQAEWIRFFGYLYHKETLADSIFNSIEKSYLALANQQKNKTNKPIILTGELFESNWTLPGGKSLTNKLIADAGGTMLTFNDTGVGSRKIDYEVVLKNQKKIDYWLLLSYDNKTLSQKYLIEKQPKYQFLSVLQQNKVWVCNSAKTPYFEQGILEPHLILNDLKNIVNQIDTTFYYFKKLPH